MNTQRIHPYKSPRCVQAVVIYGTIALAVGMAALGSVVWIVSYFAF